MCHAPVAGYAWRVTDSLWREPASRGAAPEKLGAKARAKQGVPRFYDNCLPEHLKCRLSEAFGQVHHHGLCCCGACACLRVLVNACACLRVLACAGECFGARCALTRPLWVRFCQPAARCGRPSSPFWSEHAYPNNSFWSYNLPLGGGEPGQTKARRGAPEQPNPEGGLMQEVSARVLALINEFDDREMGSVEFWAHCRTGEGSGHQLHFDLDEVGLLHDGVLRHPAVSCVLCVIT